MSVQMTKEATLTCRSNDSLKKHFEEIGYTIKIYV